MSSLNDEQIPSREKVLIVGAGPAGLAAAAALKALGIPFDLVDRSKHVGGIWNLDRKDTPVWPAMEMVSSRQFTQFEDMIQPASFPAFLDPGRMGKYLRAYAARHDLTEHFRPDAEVHHARPFGDWVWQVEFSSGEIDVYRAVVSAHGISEHPHRPDWAADVPSSVEVIDARDWTGPDGMDGKRVLVVGSGQSAADIAVDASRRALTVRWSVRTGHWIVPRRIGPVPGDVLASHEPAILGDLNQRLARALVSRSVADPEELGLPRPAAEPLDDQVIVSDNLADRIRDGRVTPVADVAAPEEDDTFRLADGSRVGADLVVLATGYRLGSDYLPDDLLPRSSDGRPDLFLGTFPRGRDDLVVLGQLRVSGGVLPVLVEQADVAAYFLRASMDQAPVAERFRRIRSRSDASVPRARTRERGVVGRLRHTAGSVTESNRRTPSPRSGAEEELVPLVDRDEMVERLRSVRSLFD